jgi:hypothetical protein
MLEHQKLLLANLQNYPDLFAKELRKSLRWLTPEQVDELHEWLSENFKQATHRSAIEAFYECYSVSA